MALIANGGGTRRSSNSGYQAGRAREAESPRRTRRRSAPPRRAPAPQPRPSRGYRPSGGRGGGVRAAAPARQRYTGPPPPSAAMIQQLFEQLGGLDLRGKQLTSDYRQRTGQLGGARDLFMRQLQDTYRQRQETTAADFANRGLAQSGLYNEALANLGTQQGQEQSAYESDYRAQLGALLQQLTGERADIRRQRGSIQNRYEQARANRDRILSMMG